MLHAQCLAYRVCPNHRVRTCWMGSAIRTGTNIWVGLWRSLMLLRQTGRTINVPWPIFMISHFLDYSRLLIYFLQKSIPNVLIYLVFSLRWCLSATEENRKIYKHSCSHQWVLTASCGKSFLKQNDRSGWRSGCLSSQFPSPNNQYHDSGMHLFQSILKWLYIYI